MPTTRPRCAPQASSITAITRLVPLADTPIPARPFGVKEGAVGREADVPRDDEPDATVDTASVGTTGGKANTPPSDATSQ